MADSKRQQRIRDKNRKKRSKGSKKAEKSAEGDSAAPEDTPKVPTGPEPKGMKEKVKRGFLTERDALKILASSQETASPRMVGWLRRRLSSAG